MKAGGMLKVGGRVKAGGIVKAGGMMKAGGLSICNNTNSDNSERLARCKIQFYHYSFKCHWTLSFQ